MNTINVLCLCSTNIKMQFMWGLQIGYDIYLGPIDIILFMVYGVEHTFFVVCLYILL